MKKLEKTYQFECPLTGHSQKYMIKSFTFIYFSSIYFSKKVTFSSGRSHRYSERNMIVLLILYRIDKNLRVQVPGQRRLAISRLRVPNLDGSVPTAAGNLLSIGAPRHRKDPVFVRSQDTNQQKKRGKNREKLTRPSARSPGTRKSTIGNLVRLCHFQACIYLSKQTSYLFEWFILQALKKGTYFFLLLF